MHAQDSQNALSHDSLKLNLRLSRPHHDGRLRIRRKLRLPPTLRGAFLTIHKLPVPLHKHMDQSDLGSIARKEPSWTRMQAMSKPKVVRRSGDELPASLLTRFLAHAEEAMAIELVRFGPMGLFGKLMGRDGDDGAFGEIGSIGELEWLHDATVHSH